MGVYGYGGFQQPQVQGGWGNAQQSQRGGDYQPQQNFGGFGGSPFGGGQQWQGGGQNWGGGYGYKQPQQQPYFGGMMGYQPEQRQSYGQFNQQKQGQYNQGGDMGFKAQGMNQDRLGAFSNATSQGKQNFQGQLGRQNNQGGQKQFDFGQAAAAAQNGSLDTNAAKGYGASDEQMNQLGG